MAESVQAGPPSLPTYVELIQNRRFYMAMAICAIVIAVLGFAPSGLDPTARRGPLTPLVAAHAAMSIAWLALFFVQTALAARRQIDLHRRLGTVTMLLAPVMIASGYMVAIAMARRGFDLSGDLGIDADPLIGLVNPLGDLATFGILVAGGYWYRQRRDVHKRLMLLATVGGLMLAPLAHLIGHSPLPREMAPIILIPIALFLFASAAYDRVSLGRIHPVSLWGATVIFIWDMLRNIAIGPSAAWHQFAQCSLAEDAGILEILREIHMESGTPLVSPSDEQAIQAVVKAYEACWNRHDMAALAELFSDDAHWVNIVGMYWPGKSAAVAGHEWIHRTFFQTTEMKVLNVAVRAITPGVAVAIAQTKMGAFTPPDGVRRPEAENRMSFVLAQRNGRWQIAHGHNTVIDPVAQPFDAVKRGSPHQER